MCQRAQCQHCSKPTFVGCGRHVEQVLGDVPQDERCSCRAQREHDAKKERSILERILGR